MTRYRFLASLMLLTLLSLPAAAAGFPLGTYHAEAMGASWQLTFDEHGSYQVKRNGEEVVEGYYTVQGNRITMTDRGGPMAEMGTDSSAIYTWELHGDSLTLTVVRDPGKGRAQVLAAGWTRAASHQHHHHAGLVFVCQTSDVDASGEPRNTVRKISLADTHGAVYAVSTPAEALKTTRVHMRVAQGDKPPDEDPGHKPYANEKTLSEWDVPCSASAQYGVVPLKFTWTGYFNVYLDTGHYRYWGRIHVTQ